MIDLDFGSFVLKAELFDTEVAKRFIQNLPYDVELTKWGNEYYGSIGIDLGEEKPLNWNIWLISREEEKEVSVQERKDKFKLISKTMEEDSVLRECDRCMRCDINTKESDIC